MGETVKTVLLWSAPLNAIIISALIWLFKSSIRHEYNKALEELKANYQRRFHVLKSQFDMEFNSFQLMWASQSALVDATIRLDNMFLSSGCGKEMEDYAKAADKAFFEAERVTRELGPFMPEEIYRNAISIEKGCKEEIDLFFHWLGHDPTKNKDFDMTKAAKETMASKQLRCHSYESLANDIRKRLESLSKAGFEGGDV